MAFSVAQCDGFLLGAAAKGAVWIPANSHSCAELLCCLAGWTGRAVMSPHVLSQPKSVLEAYWGRYAPDNPLHHH